MNKLKKTDSNSILSAVQTEECTSVDAIVKALYESVSFSPGSQPDFNRLRTLFHPDGRVVPPKREIGDDVKVFDIETFIKNSRENIILTGLEAKGFFEQETKRATEAFGNIVHVFSTYESKHVQKDASPFQRGVNSIQLVNDKGRWWVVTVMWDIEKT